MHFLGIVFGDLDNLDKYDENFEVEPYYEISFEDAIEQVSYDIKNAEKYIKDYKEKIHCEPPIDNYIKESIEYWENKKAELENLKTDEEKINYIAKDNGYVRKEDGLYSTINYDGYWDWWTIGGRWPNSLILKNGDKVDEATVGEVDWDKSLDCCCIVTNEGDWCERGDNWLPSDNEEYEDIPWEDKVKKYIATLDPDTEVFAVDFHC